jgi:hypothetical protein
MHVYNWYHSHVQTFIMYTNTDYNIHGAFPLPSLFPLPPLSDPPLLTWNPPSCDRIRPPQSQVACKLTPRYLTLSPNPPPPNSQNPITQRLTKTTSRWIRRLLSGTKLMENGIEDNMRVPVGEMEVSRKGWGIKQNYNRMEWRIQWEDQLKLEYKL